MYGWREVNSRKTHSLFGICIFRALVTVLSHVKPEMPLSVDQAHKLHSLLPYSTLIAAALVCWSIGF